MMNPDDHLVIITVKESAVKLESVESGSKAACEEFGVTHQKIEILEKPVGQSVWQVIKAYLVTE